MLTKWQTIGSKHATPHHGQTWPMAVAKILQIISNSSNGPWDHGPCHQSISCGQAKSSETTLVATPPMLHNTCINCARTHSHTGRETAHEFAGTVLITSSMAQLSSPICNEHKAYRRISVTTSTKLLSKADGKAGSKATANETNT